MVSMDDARAVRRVKEYNKPHGDGYVICVEFWPTEGHDSEPIRVYFTEQEYDDFMAQFGDRVQDFPASA